MESVFNIAIALRSEAFRTEHLETIASVTQL